MMHVYDRLSFTNKQEWWQRQGWPLLKSVARFHLQKLIADQHFKDGTLVTAPCNSPEQVPITFGCTHQQTMIWELLNAVEKGYAISGDDDEAFLRGMSLTCTTGWLSRLSTEVRSKKAAMDKGVHIGSWGQLQGENLITFLLHHTKLPVGSEWKVDLDRPNDTHRHLSHLIGLYPSYALTSFDPMLQTSAMGNHTRTEVIAAARTSLEHRGNGTGPDADSGWEKVWRASQYAQLGDMDTFYHELTVSSGLSYDARGC